MHDIHGGGSSDDSTLAEDDRTRERAQEKHTTHARDAVLHPSMQGSLDVAKPWSAIDPWLLSDVSELPRELPEPQPSLYGDSRASAAMIIFLICLAMEVQLTAKDVH